MGWRLFAVGIGIVSAFSVHSADLDITLYGVPWTGTVSGGQGIISHQRGVPYRKCRSRFFPAAGTFAVGRERACDRPGSHPVGMLPGSSFCVWYLLY